MMKWISIILGILLAALGAIPLLNIFGVLSFKIPLPTSILAYILAAGGLIILVDGFTEGWMEPIGKLSIVIGLIILIFGLAITLGNFGIIPFTVPAIGLIIYNILFVIEGLLLLIGSFYLFD